MAVRVTDLVLVWFSCFILSGRLCLCRRSTIFRGQTLGYYETMKSSSGGFMLRFYFARNNMANGYLGIWYRDLKDRDPVWVANRNNPLSSNSPEANLTIDVDGSLMILPGGDEPIFLYRASRPMNTSATLDDSGNFILHEQNPDGSIEKILWQSFDYPTDTLLPGMKIGIDHRTGHNWSLTSWRSNYLAAEGSFTLGMDPTNQLVIWWQGNVYWSSRNGRQSDLIYDELLDGLFTYSFISNKNETYFTFSRIEIESAGIFPILTIHHNGSTTIYRHGYRIGIQCFPFGVHNSKKGCIERKIPACRSRSDMSAFSPNVGVIGASGIKPSDSENISLSDCKEKCFSNCACVAYAATSNDDTGCEIWYSIATFKRSDSYDTRVIYFIDKPNRWWLWFTLAVGGGILVPILCAFLYLLWIKYIAKDNENQNILLKEIWRNVIPAAAHGTSVEHEEEWDGELQVFSLDLIAFATNNFATTNKLGQGGYGPVYKGTLPDGREIAIKRLSKSSGQGLLEFKNETVLISKLQHTNLVRHLGVCIQGGEKILVYEYMPNKSLDLFLFNPSQKSALDWNKRFNIIQGIAQGLLYLHKYSRLRVIHRDLKASNILLDHEMNPKISDFGMARIFGIKEDSANTSRLVGTYGYMSPEYAMSGIVSVKVDVFSFGVLVLEIVSGKRNNNHYHPEQPLSLIGHAWRLWNDGQGSELLDPTMEGICLQTVIRCIHVGLLCVQDQPTQRPTMLEVVSMLSNENMELPEPKQPAFYIHKIAVDDEANKPEIKSENCSVNQVSISVMEAR